MHAVTSYTGPFSFTVWGGGTAALLRKGDYIIYWQGDEAADICDQWSEDGIDALKHIWDIYSDVIVHEPEDA
jgi:hypothetical protein